jgi:hypothetical protein
MVDVVTTATEFVGVIAPYLPSLAVVGAQVKAQATEAATAAAEAGVRRYGAAAWERLQALWGTLRGRVTDTPAAHEAFDDAIATPDDPDALAALRMRIRKLLEADPDLALAVASWLDGVRSASTLVHAEGERSVAIGGGVQGSTIVTGDRVRLERARDHDEMGSGSHGKH